MEHRYVVIRKHLDELGYQQPLSIETVPLVERLLADLVKTTESLYHYKNVAQTAIEERDNLQLGAEPYKCDNAKLVKECNDLHLAFLQFKEQTDKLQRDLKHKIHMLEKENQEFVKTIDSLQKTADKTSKINPKRKTVPSKSTLASHSSVSLHTGKSRSKKIDTAKEKHVCDVDSTMPLTEQRNANLTREIKKLKSDLLRQNEACDSLKNKLNSREKEIQRLTGLLEGGRPLPALNKDCCYKDMNTRLSKLSEENTSFLKEKKELELQLAEAITKQHEAMKRALQLADRNRELEKELRDIDQMALAVEAECNTTVKQNVNRVSKYQEQLDNCNIKINNLERELAEVKRKKNTLEMELQACRDEKEKFHKILENALDDKKRMTDKINQFTRIEHDLNLEIDRLVQTSTMQKRRIAELECQMMSTRLEGKSDGEIDSDSQYKKCCKSCEKCKKCRKHRTPSVHDIVSSAKDDAIIENLKGDVEHYQNECKRLREELNRVPSTRQDNVLVEKLKCDIEQYQSECRRLREELKNISLKSNAAMDFDRKLSDKEDMIQRLERENRDVMREKHDLLAQIESMKELKQWESGMDTSSIKSVLSRVEKERDLARGDVKRLEDERDSLRKRLKTATETHMVERDRLQKLMNDSEVKYRTLEADRREMMTVQGSRRATINNLEEQIETLSTQLRTTQSELDHIHTLYNQIKTLQEQTDRALADAQGQLTQVEIEYAHAQERIRELERERSELDKEVSVLKNDLLVMKGTLSKIDAERDNLLIEVDNKTERIAALEQELKSKETKLLSLEATVTELKHQLSIRSDDTATKEYLLKNSSAELNTLRRELDEANKTKANAIAENRRIQDDLAKVTMDWRNVHGELERAHREIEDLKTQLQQYVFEIKRAEDLISKKENERAEMLDHFRSLSHEANMLETNNHTLESRAMETKTQLSMAMDQITDLENKVEQQEIMNRDYEKQISQLTAQIASMEIQIKQHASINNKTEAELAAVKGLCVKLDEQKDAMMKELNEKEGYRSHLEREKDRLKVEIDKLQGTLGKEQSNLGSLESLLASSRQETVEQRLMNQELQNEIQRLKNLVEELQSKLSSMRTSNQLDIRIQTDTSPRSANNDEYLSSPPDSARVVCEVNNIFGGQNKKVPTKVTEDISPSAPSVDVFNETFDWSRRNTMNTQMHTYLNERLDDFSRLCYPSSGRTRSNCCNCSTNTTPNSAGVNFGENLPKTSSKN